jgi:hypothetical protein
LRGSGIIWLLQESDRSQEEKPVPEVNPSSLPQQPSVPSAQKPRVRRPLRIALFGFGTVGSSVARILVESKPTGLELTHI